MNKKQNKPTMKSLEKKLWKACSDYIRNRDSSCQSPVGGNCVTCNEYCEARYAHAGHFLPNKACGLLTRYHPHNIHLQCYKCNVPRSRSVIERTKVYYTLYMINTYDLDKVKHLKSLSEIKIIPTEEFYTILTSLYKCADTENILDFIDSYCYNHRDDIRENNIREPKTTNRRTSTKNKSGVKSRSQLRLSKKKA